MSLTKSLLLPLEGIPKRHPGKSPLVQKTVFFLFTLCSPSRPSFWSPLGTLFGGSCPLFWPPPCRRQPCKLSPSRFPMCHPLWLSLLPRLLACSGAPDTSPRRGLYSVLDLQISLREHLDICFATSRGFRLLLRTSTVSRPLLRISTVSGRQQNDETSKSPFVSKAMFCVFRECSFLDVFFSRLLGSSWLLPVAIKAWWPQAP